MGVWIVLFVRDSLSGCIAEHWAPPPAARARTCRTTIDYALFRQINVGRASADEHGGLHDCCRSKCPAVVAPLTLDTTNFALCTPIKRRWQRPGSNGWWRCGSGCFVLLFRLLSELGWTGRCRAEQILTDNSGIAYGEREFPLHGLLKLFQHPRALCIFSSGKRSRLPTALFLGLH